MEAILNIGKNVVANYSYLRRVGISIIMAAVTAMIMMSMHEQAEFELSREMIITMQPAEEIEKCISEIKESNIVNNITVLEEKVIVHTSDKVVENKSESVKSGEVKEPEKSVVSITIYGNGAFPEVTTETFDADVFDISKINVPERMGKIFAGWFEDAACTIPFDGELKGKTMNLYAGWTDIPGYLCDDKGYLYGTNGLNLQDGLAILPSEKACIGVSSGLFSGVEEEVFEIYIPSNIVDIDVNAFESLPYLIYIQADEGNSAYYTNDGILYHSDGSIAFVPRMRR